MNQIKLAPQLMKYLLHLTLLFPAIAFAQSGDKVSNPLQADNIGQFLLDIVDVISTLAVPVIAIMIIYAGFLFVTAGGDSDQIEQAKETALYVVIGAAIILGADLIIAVLENTASSIGVGGFDN